MTPERRITTHTSDRRAGYPLPYVPGRSASFGWEAFVGDVAEFIEAMGLAPALEIGHSLGGVTTYQLVRRRPCAELVTVDRARYCIQREAPDTCGQAVRGFFGGLSAATTSRRLVG
jgi:pimeloyl-ACP methyl ester carboxylesterase